MGVLKQGSTVSVEITSSSADTVALTVLKVNRQDRLSEAEPNSVAVGQVQTFTTLVGARIDRMILFVSPPAGGSATVRVNALSPITADGDTQLTFDCVP